MVLNVICLDLKYIKVPESSLPINLHSITNDDNVKTCLFVFCKFIKIKIDLYTYYLCIYVLKL